MDFSVDPFTSRNPSYCFVDMETKEQADRAMRELNGVDLLGRPVKIRPGVPPKSPRSSANNGARGLATRASFTFDRWTRTDAEQHFKGYSAQGRRLYVGGLPKLFNQAAIDAKINQFFSGFQMYVHYLPFALFPTIPCSQYAARPSARSSPRLRKSATFLVTATTCLWTLPAAKKPAGPLKPSTERSGPGVADSRSPKRAATRGSRTRDSTGSPAVVRVNG